MIKSKPVRPARLALLAFGATAVIAVPLLGVADADTGALTVGSTSLVAGGSTSITVDLQSTGTGVLDFTLAVDPQGGSTGSIALDDIVTTKTPDPDPTVGWSCFAGATPNEVDCLWNGGGKSASNQATLTVTATASTDSSGAFDVTAVDNVGPVVLDSGVITVAVPPTTLVPTTLAPTTSTTSTTTTPASAGAVVTPAFTG